MKAPDPGAPVRSLSGGNQQRVVLARWLARGPRVLVLNGPTVGVDVGSKAEIHGIIRDLAGRGLGVLVISDDLPELLATCHRILVMKEGRITDDLPGRRDERRPTSRTGWRHEARPHPQRDAGGGGDRRLLRRRAPSPIRAFSRCRR